ncbi:hypothetical protein P618_201099 [Holospora obtusa F1]|uniref:Uncharacterized protein n=1 Tax=Holospora obtusa F1 TaxID=1399147 RepID=W6TFF6_HOLOB|nr:hypothetical protein P618_201099 [Holospora obtusa F1]
MCVDATSFVFKASICQERDEATKQTFENLNHEILPKFFKDKTEKIERKRMS